nr:glycosyltransferase [Metabacillus flavus]
MFITRDDRGYTVPASVYFIRELSKVTRLSVSCESGPIKEIINNAGIKPDFIYLNDYGENGSPEISGLEDLEIPFAVGLHDLHYNYPNRKKDLTGIRVKYIFTCYRDKFLNWYPEFTERMRWLPHHVNTEIFKDYKLEKDNELLMMGAALEEFYPLRRTIMKRFEERPEFVYHGHPGYRKIGEGEKKVFTGEKYAKEINRAKIFLTCDSIFHYPIMKYYEATACNTLLMAPSSRELMDLGFIPGVNFISIDEGCFEEKADYYLHHDQERERIALNGMRMVHKRHSTKKRAEEFVQFVDEILVQQSEKPCR